MIKYVKGAGATCEVINMFKQHYLGNKKPTFLACYRLLVMVPFWNFHKITITFRTAKPTLAGLLKFLKISLTWFLYYYKCNA